MIPIIEYHACCALRRLLRHAALYKICCRYAGLPRYYAAAILYATELTHVTDISRERQRLYAVIDG